MELRAGETGTVISSTNRRLAVDRERLTSCVNSRIPLGRRCGPDRSGPIYNRIDDSVRLDIIIMSQRRTVLLLTCGPIVSYRSFVCVQFADVGKAVSGTIFPLNPESTRLTTRPLCTRGIYWQNFIDSSTSVRILYNICNIYYLPFETRR